MKIQRVFIVGGTGFLGYHATQEFVKRGWQVTALGLPPGPPLNLYPDSVEVTIQDIEHIDNKELLQLLQGHDAVVFAAGMDDRYTPKKPAYPAFYRANVEVPRRLLTLAVQAGIRRAVILGSYFAYFNRTWPEMELAKHHPYIRSRVEQEQELTSIPGMETCVLELPYIFGNMPVPGWKPLWTPLIKYLRMSPVILYMTGGSACVTASTVGKAIVGAIEHGTPGACYPICDENLSWAEMLTRLAAADGRKVRVVNLPTWLVKISLFTVWLLHAIRGKEAGLDPRQFAPLQTSETYLDPDASRKALGYEPGNLAQAFQDIVVACK